MSAKGKIKTNVMCISGIVDKMMQATPKHKKNGITVINQNGKVYVFNYKRKKVE